MAFISFHLLLIELKMKILMTILWLQYEQIKMGILTKLAITLEANFQYDSTIKYYLLDVLFHILVIIIDVLSEMGETMLHLIQTTSTLPWRRYASRWAPTSRMWMLC